MVILLGLFSCGNSTSLATVYKIDGENWKKIKTATTEDDFGFLVTMTSGGTPWGYTTDTKDANYKIVFSENTDAEVVFYLVADQENNSIAYIAPDTFNTGSMEIFLSFTSVIDFFDFLL